MNEPSKEAVEAERRIEFVVRRASQSQLIGNVSEEVQQIIQSAIDSARKEDAETIKRLQGELKDRHKLAVDFVRNFKEYRDELAAVNQAAETMAREADCEVKAIRTQLAEQAAVIEKKDEAIDYAARELQMVAPMSVAITILDQASALKPSSDALAEYVKPALDALIACEEVLDRSPTRFTKCKTMEEAHGYAAAALARYPQSK